MKNLRIIKEKEEKDSSFVDFRAIEMEFRLRGRFLVRTGRTASTFLTYWEYANDVLKLSPYSFGGLLVYL